MKTLIGLLSVLVCFTVQAATWTFHGCKDNYSAVTWIQASPLQFYTMSWDWTWDQTGLGDIDSGTRFLVSGGFDSGYSGYSESLTLDIPDGYEFLTLMVTGPYPDYNGDQSNLDFPTIPGEYWLDFASDGTRRLSTTAPTDFGKWAWDGALNPNYVAPLVIHGRSHKKPK